MSDLLNKISKCIQIQDQETLKNLVLQNQTESENIKTFILSLGESELITKIDTWVSENKNELVNDSRNQQEKSKVKENRDIVVETRKEKVKYRKVAIDDSDEEATNASRMEEKSSMKGRYLNDTGDKMKDDKKDILNCKMHDKCEEMENKEDIKANDDKKDYLNDEMHNKSEKMGLKENTKENKVFSKLLKDEIKVILDSYLTKDPSKDRVITAFYDAMCSNTNYFDYSTIAKISRELVLEMVRKDKHKDGEFLRSKILNLKNSKNSELCNNVVCGKISPSEYLSLSNEEMKSSSLKMEEERILKDSLMDMQFKKIEAETDMFRCSKCKNRKTTYSQLQTRSADEPMTTFVTCVVCRHRWKF